MSYEKQGFASGDVLYATQLNAMDDQIADNETEITDLKSALSDASSALFGHKYEIDQTGKVGSYNYVFDVPIPSGKTIAIENSGASAMTVNLKDSTGTETNYGSVNPGKINEITLTFDVYAIRSYVGDTVWKCTISYDTDSAIVENMPSWNRISDVITRNSANDDWAIGTIYHGDFSPSSPKRMSDRTYIPVFPGCVVSVKSLTYVVQNYDGNKGYKNDTSWIPKGTKYTVPIDVVFIRIVLGKVNDQSDFTSDDLIAYADCVDIEYPINDCAQAFSYDHFVVGANTMSISELNSEVEANYNELKYDNLSQNESVDLGWEIGTLTNGFPQASTMRIRSGYIVAGAGTIVRCDKVLYRHLIFKYTFDGSVISDTNWIADDFVADEDCMIRILMFKRDGNPFESEEEARTVGATEIILRTLPQAYYDNVLQRLNTIDLHLPSYYSSPMSIAVNNTRQHIFEAGINGECFLFLSDIHWKGNRKRSPVICKEIMRNTQIDKIICAGDLLDGDTTETLAIEELNDLVNTYKQYGRFYVALGNHDTNDSQDIGRADSFTKQQAYALLQKQTDTYVSYGDTCYYYFDNPTTKTRFIVLDSGLETLQSDQTQLNWMTSVLNSTQDDWHVIVIMHIIYKTYTDTAPMPFASSVITVLDNHNALINKCKIEAIFAGHVHYDRDEKTPGGIPIVLIDCDGSPTYSAAGSALGTINENCVDAITINYGTKTIYCERIGRGVSRPISYA